jgi:hypothetical protein
MTPRAAALTLSLLALPLPAAADPPPVKVCVAVAGDPDESVRAGAEAVADAVSRHPSLRGVADADARAALRGDAAPADFADLAAARRSLRGTDADAPALDALSLRLGCGLVVELMARPAGAAARAYDPVRRAWSPARDLAALDANVLTAVVHPALEARHAPSPDAGAASDASVPADVTDAGAPSDAGADAGARVAAVDRRAAPTASPSQSAWSRAWPWVLVGGVALAVVGVYFLADGNTSTSTRVIVSHPGAP